MADKITFPEIVRYLKKKLKIIFGIIIIGFGIMWLVADFVIFRIKTDLLPDEGVTEVIPMENVVSINETYIIIERGAELIATSPMEYVMVKLQIAFILGVLVALPVISFFVLRKFNVKIKKNVIWILCGAGLFLLGFSFTYLFLLPTAIEILTSFAVQAGVTPFYSISQFVTFAVLTTVIFSLVFELPLVVSWLAINGFVSVKTLKERRKYVYVGIFILTAIITADPTPFSQILLSVPLIILYEISIISAKLFGKKAS
jgi:sec-independent protein translocase protein TatC